MLWILVGSSDFASAQITDSIYRYAGIGGSTKISGKIVDMTPNGVTIESRGKSTTVPSQEIRKIIYSGQVSALDRVRERILSGNFEQGLQDLPAIDDKNNVYVTHEIAFLSAWCNANLAIGGKKDLNDAGTQVNSFLKKYKKSYHFYPLTELQGKLLQNLNLSDKAAAEFELLTQSDWPEYAFKGHYLLAQSLNAQGNHAQAVVTCDAALAVSDNSDIAQQYKQLCICLKAKSEAMAGKSDGVEAPLKELIKVESPDNQQLFAQAYNAWGVYHFKAERWKEAREKFLMTHLLMTSEADSHAEALYYLSQIWPKLENTDEANRTRALLKSRYRNSYWAQKLK